MGIFDRFKKKDSSTSMNSGATTVGKSQPILNSDPSMYLIPLDHNKSPIVLQRKTGDNIMIAAVTTNGKMSFFPVDISTVDSIKERISERFPNDIDPNGNPVTHYLAAGVMMMGDQKTGSVKFIFEVCGFNQGRDGSVERLYNILSAACLAEVGSIELVEIEKLLSSGPMGEWINQSIVFLKKQLHWSEYVQNAMAEHRSTGSTSSPSIT